MSGIIRVKKKRNPFVTIDKTPLLDERLSWKARGIMAYLLTKPDDWEVSICNLVNVSKHDGKKAAQSGIKELEEAGYVARFRLQDHQGRFCGWETLVFETPEDHAEWEQNRQCQNRVIGSRPTTPFSADGLSADGLSADGFRTPLLINEDQPNNEDSVINDLTNAPPEPGAPPSQERECKNASLHKEGCQGKVVEIEAELVEDQKQDQYKEQDESQEQQSITCEKQEQDYGSTELAITVLKEPSSAPSDQILDKKVQDLIKAYDEGKITKLPDGELKLLAQAVIGTTVTQYRRSGQILSSAPNDIERPFLSFIALRDKKDFVYGTRLVAAMERNPARWGELSELVAAWQIGDVDAIPKAAKEFSDQTERQRRLQATLDILKDL